MDNSRPRGIRSFIDIRKGEAEPAALFFLFWYFAIVVFQALRPLKKGLFVEHLGADVELYAKLANIGVAIPNVKGEAHVRSVRAGTLDLALVNPIGLPRAQPRESRSRSPGIASTRTRMSIAPPAMKKSVTATIAHRRLPVAQSSIP